jgi:lysophospholipase L1-like esterase
MKRIAISVAVLIALSGRSLLCAQNSSQTAPPAAVINSNLPTVFVAGDSTAARGKGVHQQGWGVPFADYFDPARVNVVNRSRGGRSSRTFITEGLWNQLLTAVKPGDLVLIEFGINDSGAINDTNRARGSIPGLGDETNEIDNLLTKKHEVVHTYGWYMRKMIADAKARGATPIVLTLTVRNRWKDGRMQRDPDHHSEWAAEIAGAAQVQCIDVGNFVADQFDNQGEEKTKALYEQDNTHFDAAGADLHAAAVVAGLKALPSKPVGEFLSAKGKAVEPDKLAALSLSVPADPALPTLFLIGDSTVRKGSGNGDGGLWGWGDLVGTNFDAAKINVVNRALGGTSSRSYYNQGSWGRVLPMIRKGDFVMMQFGHNDSSPLNDDTRARGTIKGVGEETNDIDNLLTKQHETVHTYGWYLRQFIADTRARGATPIVCSMIPRKIWKDGKITGDKGDYAGWAEQVARASGVAFIDLNGMIASRYDEMGPAKVDPLFGDPHTHTTEAGAALNADFVAAGLRMLPDDPLAFALRATK